MMNKSIRLHEKAPPPSYWSTELLPDISRKIVQFLPFKDQIHFCSACKHWNVAKDSAFKPQFPWIVTTDDDEFSFNIDQYLLYDPDTQQSYTVQNKIKQPRSVLSPSRKLYLNDDILSDSFVAIKSRWMLLEGGFQAVRLYFYNPFSKERINLPESLNWRFMRSLITFSYCPKSRSFMVFCAHGGEDALARKLRISAWHVGLGGAEDWETSVLLDDFYFIEVYQLVCIKKTVYCIFRNGRVGAFDSVTKSWSLIIEECRDDILRSREDYFYDVVECKSKVYIVRTKDWEEVTTISWKTYRLDFKAKTWIQEDFSSADRVLFLSDVGYDRFPGSALMIQINEATKDLAGNVYLLRDGACYLYDLQNPQIENQQGFVLAKGDASRIWIEAPIGI